MKMTKYGFTYYVTKSDKIRRVIEFEGRSELQAIEKYNTFLDRTGFIRGEHLGKRVYKTKCTKPYLNGI